MGRNSVILIVFLLLNFSVAAQKSYHFIQFKDKPASLKEVPLSPKSLERREIQKINISVSDYPVNPRYISQTVLIAKSAPVIISKWLNGILVLSDSAAIAKIKSLSFVEKTCWVGNEAAFLTKNAMLECQSVQMLDYGNSAYQVQSLKADKMHNMCLNGNGIYIAVFDGGFENANNLPSLNHIYQLNRLKFTYNVVDGIENVYTRHYHGTNVMSCLAGLEPDKLIGTGFGADFALFISEDVKSEKRIEEYYWLRAAEMADSIGVDIISSSLGYYSFDNSAEDHQLTELDGKTAIITLAAIHAARKGILVVNSGGNNYTDNQWRKIVFPSDADSILSVGAVDKNGSKASFSAIGPSADGRIKPEVSAFGTSVVVNNSGNTFYTATGTSYSAPLVAGLAAGLWQSKPDITNIQLRNAIIQSSSAFNDPNNEIGYGIPDFERAYFLIHNKMPVNCQVTGLDENEFYPNPVSDMLIIQTENSMEGDTYFLVDANGKEILNGKVALGSLVKLKIDLSALKPGIYILKIGGYLQKILKM